MADRVLVIGNCDGVHRGHQELLRRARELGGQVTVVTFWPHPMTVVRPDLAPKLLCSLDERLRLLGEYGADEIQVVPFSAELSESSPETFIDEVLRPLRPAHVVVGENFRFGHRALGDVATLRAAGIETTAVPIVRAGSRDVSSTTIRQALAAGDVEGAADCLGRPFSFVGTVVHGFQRGRTLGFPTANLPVPLELAAPADGVYAGWTRRLDMPDAPRWPSAISVGTNPTFEGVGPTVESYVLDRDDLELYDVPVAVEFSHRLRGMVKFDGLDGLITQMHADVRQAKHLLSGSGVATS